MKRISHLLLFPSICVCLGLGTASLNAQFGGGAGGGPMAGRGMPVLSGRMAKLFGENSAYSATMEIKGSGGPAGGGVTIPGKLAFLDGKSRFEMDMALASGGMGGPEMAAQLKSMGMDRITTISRPDKKLSYMIYPGMKGYVENPVQDADANAPASDFKLETTELGKETVDGHPCVKNKAVVTDSKGEKHESIVWNATDLKNFPVKIEVSENGNSMTMQFKDVKLTKPEASLFDPPTDFKRHESMQAMMQEVMMQRMGANPGAMPGPGR